LYGATITLLNDFFAAQGTQVTYCDACNLHAFETALQEAQPDVVLVESISNPLLKVVDVEALAKRARVAGARLIVDGTMTTPILQRPLDLGADLVVHSATKYLGGHSDVTGGIVTARTTLLANTLRRYSKLLGAILSPFDAQLVARGIKTLDLRVRRQCENAAQIATWLVEQPEVAQVYYPGLPSHPQHELATRVFGALYGGMVSFDLQRGGRETLFRFVDSLRLILPATSLGDIYTLVSLPEIASHRDLTPEQRAERGIGDGLVRLSIGIEDVQDIIGDLRRALGKVTR
jgi:cystathionine gamma-synthase/methionine-gamma-lyase